MGHLIHIMSFVAVFSVLSHALPAANHNQADHRITESQTVERVKKQVSNDDFSDARYAGLLAFAMRDLEKMNRDVYVNWISSGFTNEKIPTWIPESLQGFSRRSDTERQSPVRKGGRGFKPVPHFPPLDFPAHFSQRLAIPRRFSSVDKSPHRFSLH